ncbi:histidine kinase [Muribaculaceae bacterium Isolate-042 (Harlan)]|mgnify:FL=1|jgi:hypothetical protein|uniref:sensor histidine kinase n=1 Tax=Muribaculum intestinale TaxID=1796646 RepID=UPI000F4AE441|nr:sensor histidine kinase [Muribaculum intestinale]ROS82969.1 histidine kinase [Muribaculaceae bacterium Isolate-042 (Harlan)]ROT07875.1 histidine kinase [Muribaculaceae bacterium Isolate-100 (HZI)]RXE66439.1 histidine kinase [Muribaculaceae bacterium Isolate-007 (NCI)]
MPTDLIKKLPDNSEPSARQQRLVKIITQFLIVAMIFILPEVLMTTNHHHHNAWPWRMYIKSALYIAVFFLNYYVIIDRCLPRPRGFVKLLGWNIIVIILFLAIILMTAPLREMPPHHHTPYIADDTIRPWLRVVSISVRDIIMVILTIGLSLAMKLSDYWMKIRQQKQEIETLRQHDELESLKRQLNPHFLFNTLNSIYALIAISPDKAQKAIHVLSKMLRYVLYENAPTVQLDDELSFISSYVELMRMRLGTGMPIKVTLSNDSPELRVAPLIFISPVENAFKHGNTGMPDAFVDIDITCRQGIIIASFANRCAISDATNYSETDKGHGIGDANLRRRLTLIYGEKALIDTTVQDGIYKVCMTIDLRDTDDI